MFPRRPGFQRRALVALIALTTLLPLIAIFWLGWRLLDQDRKQAEIQETQRLDQAAKLVVAALHQAVSSSRQQLAARNQQWPAGAVAVIFQNDSALAYPQDRVAFLPAVPPLLEPPEEAFRGGDKLEQ